MNVKSKENTELNNYFHLDLNPLTIQMKYASFVSEACDVVRGSKAATTKFSFVNFLMFYASKCEENTQKIKLENLSVSHCFPRPRRGKH